MLFYYDLHRSSEAFKNANSFDHFCTLMKGYIHPESPKMIRLWNAPLESNRDPHCWWIAYQYCHMSTVPCHFKSMRDALRNIYDNEAMDAYERAHDL